jgi:hypothetical protein
MYEYYEYDVLCVCACMQCSCDCTYVRVTAHMFVYVAVHECMYVRTCVRRASLSVLDYACMCVCMQYTCANYVSHSVLGTCVSAASSFAYASAKASDASC